MSNGKDLRKTPDSFEVPISAQLKRAKAKLMAQDADLMKLSHAARHLKVQNEEAAKAAGCNPSQLVPRIRWLVQQLEGAKAELRDQKDKKRLWTPNDPLPPEIIVKRR